MSDFEYADGFVERKEDGKYEGTLKIDGKIDLSPIYGVYFKDEDYGSYLWIRRKPILEYDIETQSYKKRERKPMFECYLKKQVSDNAVAYKGTFFFMHFKFSITGVWDAVLGNDKKHRLNLFTERLPMEQQTIINSINERKKNERRTDK